MAVPTSDRTRTGLRPTRSDTLPHTGASTNWAMEKEATSSPTWVAEAPKRSA